MMGGEKMHSKWHWMCCWKPLLGLVLWVAGLACLLFAWWAVRKAAQPGATLQDLPWGLEPLAWYWNALVLGVLAIGAKGHGGANCGTCMPEKTEM